MKKLKTVKDFIKFFDAIPEDKWITGTFANGDKCCAIGHLGMRKWGDQPEAVTTLAKLVGQDREYPEVIASVNNNGSWDEDYSELGKTPKERVLNYLCLVNAKMLK
jgi:hypothetical protein